MLMLLPKHLILYPAFSAKNGIYITLVKDVRDAFEGNDLVKIDCEGLNPSDYKKIGAKLRVLFIPIKFTVFISLPIVEVNPVYILFLTPLATIIHISIFAGSCSLCSFIIR
jgi:hypothetical protein